MRLSYAVVALLPLSTALAVPTLYTDRTAFNADGRLAAQLLSLIDFDSDAAGADLTNATRLGATLSAPGSGPLTVITGAAGVRNPMSPSSGSNFLSPGGSTPDLQNDDLRIDFASPISAFGLDVIFDVPDGLSFVSVTFFDVTGAVIASNGFIPAPSGAPGYQFIGLVVDSPLIASVLFDEFDDSAADDNVGYDTLTFTAVPAPASLALAGAGLAAAARRRR